MVGYSRLIGWNEAGTLAALRSIRSELIDPRIADHKGRVFKTTGDGVLAEFPSVVDAVACAMDIQRNMPTRNADLPTDRAIRLRIGINVGDVIVEGEDVFGDGVNVAVRLERVAPPGGITVSSVVRDQIGNRLDLEFEDMGEQELRNIQQPVRIFRVSAQNRLSQSSLAVERTESALSIAVLPFDNMSGIPEQGYIGEGIAENIITDLSTTSIKHFGKAAAIDPRYAKAHAKIAWGHLSNLFLGWSADDAVSIGAARKAADAALRADDAEAWAHWAAASCAMYNRQYDRGLAGMRRALELNPNDADVLTDMGLFCTWAGRAEEALTFALKAMRINPHYPEYYAAQLGQIYFDARQYDNAVRTIESIRTLDTPLMRLYHAALGHNEAADANIARLLASEPHSTVSYWTSHELAPYREDSDREHLSDNIRKAGLPE